MTGKHTPGPWEVDTAKEHGAVVYQIAARDGDTTVATVAGYKGCVHGSLRRLPADENTANACLIEAVPEMVAALLPIAAAYPDDPGTSDLDNEQPVTITLGDVRRVWAALGKAGVR